MSEDGAIETTVAGIGTPSRKLTWMVALVCTTCAAVTTFPSAETSTPEPTPSRLDIAPSAPGPDAGTSAVVRISTTEGLVRRNTSRKGCAPAALATRSRALDAIAPTRRLCMCVFLN